MTIPRGVLDERYSGPGVPAVGWDDTRAVLANNDHVALPVANDEWRGGLDVVLEGRAEQVADEAPPRALADAWLVKWDGQWRYDVVDGGFAARHGVARVFAVRPAKVIAFGKEPFTQTTFRFWRAPSPSNRPHRVD